MKLKLGTKVFNQNQGIKIYIIFLLQSNFCETFIRILIEKIL